MHMQHAHISYAIWPILFCAKKKKNLYHRRGNLLLCRHYCSSQFHLCKNDSGHLVAFASLLEQLHLFTSWKRRVQAILNTHFSFNFMINANINLNLNENTTEIMEQRTAQTYYTMIVYMCKHDYCFYKMLSGLQLHQFVQFECI